VAGTRTQREQRTQSVERRGAEHRGAERRRIRVWVIAAVLTASAPLHSASSAPSASSSAQQPTFRSGTRLIVQTVTVKDRDGKPLEGLTAKDFVVTEDGEPQTVAFVEYQRIDGSSEQQLATSAATSAPSRSASSAPSASSSQPQSNLDARYRDRRLVVLYFDQTALPPPDLMRAFSAARSYVGMQMQPQDLLAVMTFEGGGVRIRQEFTDDRAKLNEVILRIIAGNDLDGDGIPDATDDIGTAFGQDDAEFSILNTDRQLSALQTAVGMLRPFPEQKSLVYFASGLRLNGIDNQAQLRATINAAIRSNVSIFPVDARGLVATAPLGDASRPSPGGIGMLTGRLAENQMTGFQRSQDTLYGLAKDTGGKALFDYNDLSVGIAQAAAAITSYYIIGYYSTHTALDGKFRRVRVSLAGGRAGELAHRQGYFADKEFAKFNAADRERQLEEAFMLENPITEITIATEVNYFQLNRAEYFVPVAVKIPGSELALARRGGASRTVIDFIGEVKDDYGVTIQNVRDRLDIKINDETAAELARRPIQYETGFTLLPGKYVLKILARDSETGRIGTFLAPFTIPNLNREEQRIPTSTVVLSSQRVPLTDALYSVKQKVTSDTVNPLVADGKKLVPSVTRVFSRNRDLHVFMQAYQRAATTTQPLAAFVTFYRAGVKAFETQPLAVTDGLDPRSKAVPLRFTIPLAGIEPGRYECQVTVLDPGGSKAAFWRAPIVVVP
jgi:VWFA-related protein